MEFDLAYKILNLIFGATSAFNAFLGISDKMRQRRTRQILLGENDAKSVINKESNSGPRLTQAKLRAMLPSLMYIGLYVPYALIVSNGVFYLNELVVTDWGKWILSGAFTTLVWWEGLELFGVRGGHRVWFWLLLWVLTSLYGGFGLFMQFNPSLWTSDRIAVIIVQQVLYFITLFVMLIHSMRRLRTWREQLPEE